jgi:hypothetical protein
MKDAVARAVIENADGIKVQIDLVDVSVTAKMPISAGPTPLAYKSLLMSSNSSSTYKRAVSQLVLTTQIW